MDASVEKKKNLVKQVSSGEWLDGIVAAIYNQLVVNDMDQSGQRLRVYYECTIGHIACVASFNRISLNYSVWIVFLVIIVDDWCMYNNVITVYGHTALMQSHCLFLQHGLT